MSADRRKILITLEGRDVACGWEEESRRGRYTSAWIRLLLTPCTRPYTTEAHCPWAITVSCTWLALCLTSRLMGVFPFFHSYPYHCTSWRTLMQYFENLFRSDEDPREFVPAWENELQRRTIAAQRTRMRWHKPATPRARKRFMQRLENESARQMRTFSKRKRRAWIGHRGTNELTHDRNGNVRIGDENTWDCPDWGYDNMSAPRPELQRKHEWVEINEITPFHLEAGYEGHQGDLMDHVFPDEYADDGAWDEMLCEEFERLKKLHGLRDRDFHDTFCTDTSDVTEATAMFIDRSRRATAQTSDLSYDQPAQSSSSMQLDEMWRRSKLEERIDDRWHRRSSEPKMMLGLIRASSPMSSVRHSSVVILDTPHMQKFLGRYARIRLKGGRLIWMLHPMMDPHCWICNRLDAICSRHYRLRQDRPLTRDEFIAWRALELRDQLALLDLIDWARDSAFARQNGRMYIGDACGRKLHEMTDDDIVSWRSMPREVREQLLVPDGTWCLGPRRRTRHQSWKCGTKVRKTWQRRVIDRPTRKRKANRRCTTGTLELSRVGKYEPASASVLGKVPHRWTYADDLVVRRWAATESSCDCDDTRSIAA